MGKLTTYTLVMGGLVLLFYFGGMINQTANSTLLDLLLGVESFRSSELVSVMIIAIEAIVATGVLIGAVFAGRLELAARAGVAIFLLNLLWDFVTIFSVVESVASVLSILIFGPIIFVYFITVVEWWGKHD